MRTILALGVMLLLAGCGGGTPRGTAFGEPASIECAPFAREVSGLHLYGDAAAWWDQAAGRYQRGNQPREGGVLVFQRSSRLPAGHVSVVARQVSDREIRVTQANWVHHMITRDEPVLDVSSRNDWSQVRVWWAPAHALGSTVYQTYGFIAPDRSRPRDDLLAGVVRP